jgi:hypothetical protein
MHHPHDPATCLVGLVLDYVTYGCKEKHGILSVTTSLSDIHVSVHVL